MEKQLLKGQTAVITGASRGIGKAIADLFATEGASVVMTSIDKEELEQAVDDIKKAGGKAIGMEVDATSAQGCKDVFATAIKEFGQVDILVCNAGFGDMSSIEETSDEHFYMVTEINLMHLFRYNREAIQHFLPRNKGVIVNVSSVNGIRPVCGVAYTTTKGAVSTMTHNLGIRFAGTGIRANVLAPGVTDTKMAKAWAAGELVGGNLMNEVAGHYFNGTLPATQPIDQAYAALYLASDMSRCVTGQVLQVCNGAFL